MVDGTLPTRYKIPYCYLTDDEWHTLTHHTIRVYPIWELGHESYILPPSTEEYDRVIEKLMKLSTVR